MNTNFFNQIQQLDFTGVLQLTIAKGAENYLIVSVLPQNEGCGDNAKNLITPLNFRGTAEELDNDFFDKMTTPVQMASGLMVEMEAFMKHMEEVKKQSLMEKERAEKGRKEKEAKDKKYNEMMAKADELEKAGKYREAWIKVPEPSEFPDKKEEIVKRRSALSAKFEPDLFASTQQEKKPEPEKEGLYPQYPEIDEEDLYYEEEEQEY